jgi:hypothetical protein
VRRFKEGILKGGNIWKTLRGNPEALNLCRVRKAGKVANLGRGGGLERVSRNFLLVTLWRAPTNMRKWWKSPGEEQVPRKTYR